MTTRRTPDEGLSAMTDHDAAPDADQELPAGPSRSRRLSASDTVLWDLDRDPVLRSTITAVALLDRAPDWGRLRTRIDRASQLIPRMRQRVGPAPFGIGAPRWVDDGDFDLDHHLRRHATVDETGMDQRGHGVPGQRLARGQDRLRRRRRRQGQGEERDGGAGQAAHAAA